MVNVRQLFSFNSWHLSFHNLQASVFCSVESAASFIFIDLKEIFLFSLVVLIFFPVFIFQQFYYDQCRFILFVFILHGIHST